MSLCSEVIVLTLFKSTLIFDLSNIQTLDMQPEVLLYILGNLLIGSLAMFNGTMVWLVINVRILPVDIFPTQ